MTAARSDLMKKKFTNSQQDIIADMFEAWSGDRKFRDAFYEDCERLIAASQPDREAVVLAVKDLHHTANEWADAAINGQQWLRNIVDGISTPAEALENMNSNIAHCVSVRDASMPLSAILSLLSGAGTKSAPVIAAPHNSGERDPSVMPDCAGADTKSDGGRIYTIEHDGFVGSMQGSYITREGKRGVVLQQVGTRVVHVYGEKWLKTPDVKPAPIADSSEAGRGDAERTDYKALFEMHESALIELWSLLGANGQHDAVTKLRALSAPVGEPYAYAKQIGSDIVRTHSLKHMMPEARAEYTIPLYTHLPAPAVGPDVREAFKSPTKCAACGKLYSDHAPEGDPVCECAARSVRALKEEMDAALTRPLGGEDTKIIYRDGGSTPADLNPINHEQRNRRRK